MSDHCYQTLRTNFFFLRIHVRKIPVGNTADSCTVNRQTSKLHTEKSRLNFSPLSFWRPDRARQHHSHFQYAGRGSAKLQLHGLLLGGLSSRSFSIAVLFPLFLGFGGILLVLNPQMNGEILTNPLTPICVAYGLLAALGMLVLRKLGEKHEATLVTTFYFSLASATVGLIGSLCTDDKNLLSLFADPFLLLAVLLTLLFQIAKTFSWQYGDSALNSIYLFLGAPFVVILGWLFLNEMPTAFQILGIVFIVGSAVSSYFIISRLKKNRQVRQDN